MNKCVRNCRMCGECKVEQKPPTGLMGTKPVPDCPWKVVSIDLIQEKFKNMYSDVKTEIGKSTIRNAHQYNLRWRLVEFQQGQKVWQRNKIQSDAFNYINAKLSPMYIGPFAIKKELRMWTYELQDAEGISKGVWHVQYLKPVAV